MPPLRSPLHRLLLAWFLAAVPAWPALGGADDPLRIAALEPPVWVVRDERRGPAHPGMALAAGDTLYTGNGGRLHLELDGGGRLDLDERGFAFVGQLAPPEEGRPLLRFDLFRGTLRYRSGEGRRPVQIDGVGFAARLGAGELWAEVTPQEDRLVLAAGRLELRHGERDYLLDQRGQLLRVPAGGAPEPLASLPEAELKARLAELERLPGHGLMVTGGRWQAVLSSMHREADAEALAQRFRQAGYPAEVVEAEVGGELWRRVVIDGFADRDDALAFAAAVAGKFGIGRPWPNQRQN